MPKLQLQHTSMKIIIVMFYTSLVWGVWYDLRIIFLVGGLLCLHTHCCLAKSAPMYCAVIHSPNQGLSNLKRKNPKSHSQQPLR